MNYKVDHIPVNTPKNRRPGIEMAPEYLTIHSTANPNSTALNERSWLENSYNNRVASWHICVDENEAVEAIPLNEVAWHAGDGSKGPGNRKSISIEICESGDREKTLENAAKLVVRMLKERGWGIDRLRRHYDWSGKNCPRILNYNNWKGWEIFKQSVKDKLTPKVEVVKELDIVKEGKKYRGWLLKLGDEYITVNETRAFAESNGQNVIAKIDEGKVVVTSGAYEKLREIQAIVKEVK